MVVIKKAKVVYLSAISRPSYLQRLVLLTVVATTGKQETVGSKDADLCLPSSPCSDLTLTRLARLLSKNSFRWSPTKLLGRDMVRGRLLPGEQVGGRGSQGLRQPAKAATSRASIRLAEESPLESLAVLGTHEVVEDGVEGGGEEVEAAGEVEEVLVHSPEVLVLSEVHVTQSLEVERCPRDKEENHHRHWKS